MDYRSAVIWEGKLKEETLPRLTDLTQDRADECKILVTYRVQKSSFTYLLNSYLPTNIDRYIEIDT